MWLLPFCYIYTKKYKIYASFATFVVVIIVIPSNYYNYLCCCYPIQLLLHYYLFVLLLSHPTICIVVSEQFTCEPRFLLGLARIYDMLNDPDNAIVYYKRVLVLDASSVESIACLGAHSFYSDQVVETFIFKHNYTSHNVVLSRRAPSYFCAFCNFHTFIF